MLILSAFVKNIFSNYSQKTAFANSLGVFDRGFQHLLWINFLIWVYGLLDYFFYKAQINLFDSDCLGFSWACFCRFCLSLLGFSLTRLMCYVRHTILFCLDLNLIDVKSSCILSRVLTQNEIFLRLSQDNRFSIKRVEIIICDRFVKLLSESDRFIMPQQA